MHVLSKEEFQRDAEPILHQIFIGNNDTEPFHPQIKERLLIYFPIGGEAKRNHFYCPELATQMLVDSGLVKLGV